MKINLFTNTTNVMEILILKIMLSWAIMLIGFVALFAGCNNAKTNGPGNTAVKDSLQQSVPDNTRTDGIKQEHAADTVLQKN